jgi:cytoskeletal protein CcmA (bactofilin family)
VVIKGNCKGSIKVKEGNVSIEGQMSHGDIIAGGNVSITGTFQGGKIEAQGKIFVNGTCNGTLMGKDIEIGHDARGTGDLLYSDSISIAKGAIVEIQIKKSGDELKKPEESGDAKGVSVETIPSVSEIIKTQFPVTSTSGD